ncbi:hypothetical protein PbB2_01242 [Candidatus Phycosocius bacilliformis]|uniref:Uncharacterized protein n=1 Tax=Candidatus Phycosocius bacilliformis TaxID=1445552 RepID=A0A2P2E944_9PROT|nr:hypothetical protein [Candidatus Phycosocius bacilliformis]GBF57575.1 hypothetical protein PbB2_01242 [Candidatus Phycosocius bacilliformis]
MISRHMVQRWMAGVCLLVVVPSSTLAATQAEERTLACAEALRLDGLVPYHQATLENGILDLSFGRNAVWGRWKLALKDVHVAAPSEEAGFFILKITCRNEQTCIQAGEMETFSSRQASHFMPFKTAAEADRAYQQIISRQRACNVS